MAVTEIACMGVKPGMNLMDETTNEGQVLRRTWKGILSLPGGPSRVYWSLEGEAPSKIWALFDWASVEQHENFAATYGAEAVKHLPEVLSHGEFTKHISLAPFPPIALMSSVTHVVLAYFAEEILPEEKDETVSKFKCFVEKGVDENSEIEAMSFGWGVENDFPVRGGDEGQNGTLLTAFIGWSSLDAFLSSKETGVWNHSVKEIEHIEGVVKVVVLHMRCENLTANTE